MCVKRYAVRRGRKRYVYLRLVQAHRDEQGRVRHRVLKTLGREDELKASGQLELLMGSFARLDPPLAGVRREVGPLLLAWHFIGELDLIGTVDRALPQRGRQQLSAGEAAAALICSRLCSRSPLYDIAGWASGAALQELFGIPAALLNDDRLGRALEILAVYAETLRGTLAARAVERFGVDAGRLHVDLTALRVAGAYEGSALIANGWAQGQGVARQVRALQAASSDGVSLYVRPEPGNAAEVSLIAQSLERLRQLSGPGGVLILDSACGQPKTLCEIARAELSFIVPLRVQTGFRERFLADVGHERLRALRYVSGRERRLPAELRSRYRGALADWEVTDPETGETRRLRVAYIHSSEEQRETAAARERALRKAEEQLQRVRNGLGGRYYKTRKQVEKRIARIVGTNLEGLITTTTGTRKGRPTLSWAREHEAIAAAAQTDGIYALATNLPAARLSAGHVLRAYKGQHIVERRHRDYKQTLKVRPIFLHNDDRIYALTSIIGIALLIFGLIETELRKQLHEEEPLPGLLPENRAAKPTGRNVLSTFQGLGLTYTRTGIELDRLTHTQRRVLELLKITPPWPEQTPADLTLT
ncbi:MAG TPA: IS1634 family transposase [Kofleriaceae bacterium]|nr:IS1634 family transposase [Kofleriaceae bacterium]